MPEAEGTSASVASDTDFELGRTALHEITPPETIGAPAGSIDEGDGVVSVYFDTTMPGYPGWRWTVSIAHVDGAEPTVLETELTPGETALLSPAWVPWADRLADYKAAQAELAAAGVLSDEDDDDHDDEDDDDDFDDDDDDDDALLHSGDLDGVDIESLEDDDSDDDDSDVDSAPDADDDEADDAEPDTDQAGEEPPVVATRQRRKQQKHDD